MADSKDRPEQGPTKHGQARRLAEQAMRARTEGRTEEADRLFDQAQRTDPEAVADVLQERDQVPGLRQAPGQRGGAGRDKEVGEVTREVQPGSDAPSRAGVTGAGSGADSERR